MKHIIGKLLAIVAVAAVGCLSACSERDMVIEGNGIQSQTWTDVNDAAIAGEILPFEFEADGAWTAVSSEPWCRVVSKTGPAGLSALRIKVDANEGEMGRSAVITVCVENAPQTATFVVRQGDGMIEKGPGKYRDVNKWMYDFMAENYLWNDNMASLRLDYSLDYDRFLLQTLQRIGANGDINHDDGLWKDGQRTAYFTYVQSKAPVSRVTGQSYNDSGILKLQATQLGNGSNGPIGYVVIAVTPGTEAARAGIKRGDFINKVNNIAVTADNYQTLARNVYSGNCIVEVNDVAWNNGVPTLNSRGNVQYSSSAYVDPAIYKSTVITTDNGRKVGYLLYMGFNMTFDESLLAAFADFKTAGIDELVLDLRYNNGGHVLSSTVMGTLIAGADKKDQIYVKTTYNKTRTARGETGVYRIGNPENPEQAEGYAPIQQALNNALGLKRVYVVTSGTTASAAELVINGLRGLDIDVRLVGQNTMGKNVGMEGTMRTFYGYQFIFYPVTFYCENARGFNKYSGGFAPDVAINDANIYPGDFATGADPLSAAALSWASTGTKPAAKVRALSTAKPCRLLPLDTDSRPVSRHPGGNLQLPR